MPYGLGEVTVEVKVGTDVSVGGGGSDVFVGGAVVTVGRDVSVAVGEPGIMVTPGTGVRVGMFGTQSR
jgi:hypothetical protein